jgi:AbrB family looped-hinge helix DNA binding protein
MSNNYRIQVGRRGVITIPKEWRDQDNISDGDVLNLINLSGDVYVISRRRSKIGQVANKLANEWEKSGETLDSMLSALCEGRTD